MSKQLFFCSTNKSNKGQLHILLNFTKPCYWSLPCSVLLPTRQLWVSILIAWDFPFSSLFPTSLWYGCSLGYGCLEGPAPNQIVLRTKHPESLVVDSSLKKGLQGMLLFTQQPAAWGYPRCANHSTTKGESCPCPPSGGAWPRGNALWDWSHSGGRPIQSLPL